MKCKICDHTVTPIHSFGQMPIANAFLTEDQFSNEYFFELAVGFCEHCKTFQLLYLPDDRQLFHDHYSFQTSGSQVMTKHFEAMAQSYCEHWLKQKANPFIVEIGSNDGSMLCHIAARNIRHLGIEPSANVAEIAMNRGVQTEVTLFNSTNAQAIANQYGKADLISVANVHFGNMNDVALGIKYLLKQDGVFVFEDPYLGNVITQIAYDQIYDEHRYLFSFNSIKFIFKQVGMELFHIETYPTYGGSIRYFIGFKGQHPIEQSALQFEAKENNELKLNHLETYLNFAKQCEQHKAHTIRLLGDLKAQHKRIVGYGAPAKSTTVLNYCGIGTETIDCIYDSAPLKQGRFSPGKHVSVRAFDNNWAKEADYALLFIWNYAQAIFEKEHQFKQAGKHWIMLVPEIKVL